VILWTLWRRGLLRRVDREKIAFFLGRTGDPLFLSRRYPLWRRLIGPGPLVSVARADGMARWLEYRINLFDGVEG